MSQFLNYCLSIVPSGYSFLSNSYDAHKNTRGVKAYGTVHERLKEVPGADNGRKNVCKETAYQSFQGLAAFFDLSSATALLSYAITPLSALKTTAIIASSGSVGSGILSTVSAACQLFQANQELQDLDLKDTGYDITTEGAASDLHAKLIEMRIQVTKKKTIYTFLTAFLGLLNLAVLAGQPEQVLDLIPEVGLTYGLGGLSLLFGIVKWTHTRHINTQHAESLKQFKEELENESSTFDPPLLEASVQSYVIEKQETDLEQARRIGSKIQVKQQKLINVVDTPS